MVDYRKQKCHKCGSIGMNSTNIVNVKTGVDKGFVGNCNRCGTAHDCGEYRPDGTGRNIKVLTT